MKTKPIINIVSIGLIAGSIAGLINSIYYIVVNRYIQYKMFRLVAFSFRNYLNRWIVWFVVASVAGFIIFLATLFLVRLYLLPLVRRLLPPKIVEINIKDEKRLVHISSIVLFSSVFFLSAGYIINHYWLPHKFHPISLLGDVGILLFTIFLGWILIKINLLKIILKYVKGAALFLIVVILVLNLSIVIDNKINTPKGPNVIIILIDTLRRDHVGIYGYPRDTTPNIDRFSKEATIFQNAISQSSWTLPSVASLFSSLYPSVHGTNRIKDRMPPLDYKIVTLAEALKEKGYATAAVSANSFFIRKDFKFDQGFDIFEQFALSKPPASEVNKKAFKWINKINKNKPFFLYLHYMDPHGPYEPPVPYNSFFKSTELRQMSVGELTNFPYENKYIEDYNLYSYIDLYDGEIRYVDHEIGQFLEVLKKCALFDNTIIIVTADHGEAFLEHGLGDHGKDLYSEVINIPLIIKFPKSIKSTGLYQYQYEVRLIDVMPTILHILNCRVPYDMDGLDLFKKQDKKMLNDHATFSELLEEHIKNPFGDKKDIKKPLIPPIIAMIKDGFKAIYLIEEQKIAELYDLKADRLEKNNLIQRYLDRAKEFEEKIKSWREEKLQKRSKLGLGFKKTVTMIKSESEINKLRALGYLQ